MALIILSFVEEFQMNVRTVVLVLGLFSVLSTAAGGYLYYTSVRESSLREIEDEIVATNNALRDDIVRLVSFNHDAVKALAGFEQLQEALVDNQNTGTLLQANRALDHFAEGLGYDVCFLIDNLGNAIASSNRNQPDSFVGVNYLFRKYFQDAIQGRPSVELALGLVTRVRGIFVSHPVYLPDGAKPIGVVVIKVSTRELDRVFSRARNMIGLLVNSDGMIFVSSRENWILNLLWRLAPEELARIAETRQFGKGPWNWTGLEKKPDNQAIESSGALYAIQEMSLENCPGWRIVSLYSYNTLSEKIFNPLVGKTGYMAFILCLMVGGAVIVLYTIAQRDIRGRKKSEKDLEKERDKAQLYLDVVGVLVVALNVEGLVVLINRKGCELLGYTEGEILSKNWFDVCVQKEIREEAKGFFDKLLTGVGAPVKYHENPVLTKDGEERVIAFNYSLIRDQTSSVTGVLFSGEDITERKQAEKALSESEERFRRMFENHSAVMVLVELGTGRIIDANYAAEQFYGYTIPKLRSMTAHDINPMPPEELQSLGRAAMSGEENVFFFQHRLASGEIREVEIHTSPIEQNGKQILFSIIHDITDRKIAQDSLLESEQFLRQSEKIARIGGWKANPYTDSLHWTEGVYDILEAPRDYSPGLEEGLKFYTVPYIPILKEALTKTIELGEPFKVEAEVVTTTGRHLWVEVRGLMRVEEGQQPQVIGSFQDITEHKQMEDGLRRTKEEWEETFNAVPDLIAILNNKYELVRVNRAMAERLGLPAEDCIGLTCYKAVHGTDAPPAYCPNSLLLRDGEEHSIEVYVESLGGDYMVTTSPLRDTSGCVVGSVHVAHDIAERKKAEDELRASKQRYKSLYSMMRLMCDNVPDLIWAKDLDRRFLFVNRAVCEKLLLARDTTEPLGKGDMFFVQRERDAHSDNPNWHTFGEICVDSDAVVLGTRKSQRFDEFGNVKGEFLNLDVYKAPFINEQGEMIGTVGCGRDVTETRNLRTQLMRAQKMEAIGTLAGGIAHDFNNLLQVVLGFSGLMIANPSLPDQFRRSIKSINKAALSGADLVSRLLTFARKTETWPTPLNLNDKIIQISELLDRTISKMIQIELRLSKNPALIDADASQIEQIIMNLAVNAGHAMPEGGKLVIETQTVNLDRAYCLIHAEATPGPHILLSVSDTGTGMDKETVERIFEPFFTTKSHGTGTGLGLAMVYGIVKQHAGHTTCYSEPGEGTTFNIYFPAMVDESKPQETAELVVPKGGTETILLVDDDDSVRDVGKEMLLEYGYRVITASNGREALEIYSAERDSISLVILDLLMPMMSGKECLRGLFEIDPKVRILMVSGFVEDGGIRDVLDSGAWGFIGKPFDVPQLLEKIRKIIDEE